MAPSSGSAVMGTSIIHFMSARDVRVCLAFWLFGLINNVLYVIILSAAVDLVPAATPKGVVLFANIAPAFLAKLIAPYCIHAVTYGIRMLCLAVISVMGMVLVASMQSMAARLCGIAVASLSSGLGELSFLGLSHYYGNYALAGFASGTGAAGLVGAGAYFAATTYLGLSARSTILASSGLPVAIVLCYFVLLPPHVESGAYEPLAQGPHQPYNVRENDQVPAVVETQPPPSSEPDSSGSVSFWQYLDKVKALFRPYMLPMFLVYTAEYIALSAVAPVLLFPLEKSPFSQLRDFYPGYNAVYQLGVFISRSSILLLRIQDLYTPSLLQVLNLTLLLVQAVLFVVSHTWPILALYLWVGLLGGAVYVNTFAKINDEVAEHDREFSLQATGVADSAGILLASFSSMAIEPAICAVQTRQHRTLCKQV